MKKNKILISLIHNNDTIRLACIRPNIDNLIKKIEEIATIESYEISYQPEIKPVNFWIGILRDLMYFRLNREWINYRENKNKFLPYAFLIFIIKEFKKYFIYKKDGKKWLRSCSIEMTVSNKHINAYSYALQTKTDYLIILEDDAVFKNNSIEKIFNLINNLSDKNTYPVYIDLAGGCDIADLKISKLEYKKDSSFRYYKKPVTNTACCYLINREQLRLFDYYLIKNPISRYLGIDWMMNKLFIDQSKDGILAKCLHTDPTFLKHGSVTGEYKPWVR